MMFLSSAFSESGLPVQMCSIAVKSMKPRKRGAIVNIGSASATYLPSYPLYAVYAATKVRSSGQ